MADEIYSLAPGKNLKKYLLFARHISYKRGVNGYYPGGTEDGAK